MMNRPPAFSAPHQVARERYSSNRVQGRRTVHGLRVWETSSPEDEPYNYYFLHKFSTLWTMLILNVTVTAFDVIDHVILFTQLSHSFGVTGTAYSWIQFYPVSYTHLTLPTIYSV